MKYAKAEDSEPMKKGDKKNLTREDFKKDLEEAVRSANKKPKKKPKKSYGAKGSYAGWTVAQLRSHINEKKKALLTKNGFPDGKNPRSKEGMIALCKKLKRKRF